MKDSTSHRLQHHLHHQGPAVNPGEYSSEGAEGFKLYKGRCFYIFNYTNNTMAVVTSRHLERGVWEEVKWSSIARQDVTSRGMGSAAREWVAQIASRQHRAQSPGMHAHLLRVRDDLLQLPQLL